MSTPRLADSAPESATGRAIADRNVGMFRFWFVGQRWEQFDHLLLTAHDRLGERE